MKEYPVFIPFGREDIAAIVAVPDARPRGLVLLQTGLGATRSHRFGLWTRTARRLADGHDLASVRWDYLGIGDSSGEIDAWSEHDIPIDQQHAVAEFCTAALMVDRVAAAGNCIGSWATLRFAAEYPSCVGAVLIRMPLVASRRRRPAAEEALRSFLRARPRLKSLAARFARSRAHAKAGFGRDLRPVLERTPVVMIYGERDFTFGQGVQRAVDHLIGTLPRSSRQRFELMVLPGARLSGFESVELQDRVIDTVTSWLAKRFLPDQDSLEQTNSAIS